MLGRSDNLDNQTSERKEKTFKWDLASGGPRSEVEKLVIELREWCGVRSGDRLVRFGGFEAGWSQTERGVNGGIGVG